LSVLAGSALGLLAGVSCPAGSAVPPLLMGLFNVKRHFYVRVAFNMIYPWRKPGTVSPRHCYTLTQNASNSGAVSRMEASA